MVAKNYFLTYRVNNRVFIIIKRDEKIYFSYPAQFIDMFFVQ